MKGTEFDVLMARYVWDGGKAMPSANYQLETIRDLIRYIEQGHPDDDLHPFTRLDILGYGSQLAIRVRDLDRHITAGGDLPTVWNASHPPF